MDEFNAKKVQQWHYDRNDDGIDKDLVLNYYKN